MTQDAFHVDEITRVRVQRRTLRVLWGSAVFTRGAVAAMFPVSVLAIKDLLGSETWAGLASGATTVGAAASAAALAALMQRRGRNIGLSLGFALATVGGALAIFAVERGSLAWFLLALVLIGVGTGAANLSRYAATDLALPDRRSFDLSTVIFASTLGAVVFPNLIGITGELAERMGFDETAGGFALSVLSFGLAALLVFVFMRPDPLVVAGGVDPTGQTKRDVVPFRTATAIAFRSPLARLAFVALVTSQAVMIMVMAMTPLHMDAHGHSTGVIGRVISAHTAGMFAFAPLAGWLSDRIGRVQTIGLGGATLVAATIITALAGEAPRILMFPGLFLLGLGWSFGIVAGSALLTESVDEGDRVAVQGAADTATNIASGAGALASGFVLSMAGFHILSMIGMAAAGVLLVQAYFENRVAVARS